MDEEMKRTAVGNEDTETGKRISGLDDGGGLGGPDGDVLDDGTIGLDNGDESPDGADGDELLGGAEGSDDGDDDSGDEDGADGDESGDEDGIDGEESDGEGSGEESGQPGSLARVSLVDPVYTRRLPLSLLAAVIGGLLGFIPAALCSYLFGTEFYPLFIATPLLIFLFNSLLKGGRDIRTLFIVAVFSLASAYVTAIACQAAIYVAAYRLSIIQILTLTYLAIGKSGIIPNTAASYVYPLIFTALGVVLTWELLLNAARRAAMGEPEDGDGDEGEDEDEPEGGDDESDDGEESEDEDGDEPEDDEPGDSDEPGDGDGDESEDDDKNDK